MSGMLAKVINSTVGTSNFKSLDEVLTGDKSIVASDEVYYSFPPELRNISGLANSTTHDLFTFTLPLDGSCNIHFKTGWSSDNASTYIYLEAYKNGTLAYSISQLVRDTGSSEEDDLRIDGNKGDTFTVKLRASANSTRTATIFLYSINATVVDSKTMNVTSLR